MFKLKVPRYEDPYERFFAGLCELAIEDSRTGASCNAGYLWQVVQLPDRFFPLVIKGVMFSRLDLVAEAALNLSALLDQVPSEHLPRFLQTCEISEDDLSYFSCEKY